MLSTSQMQRLVAVADHDTITKAAKSLYLTQPALSRSLRRIETELGVDLFDRVEKNKFSFNETGLKAVEKSREILKQIAALEKSLKEEGIYLNKLTSIGACTPPALWAALPLLAQEYPEYVFSTIIENTTALEQALFNKDISAAFLSKPINTAEYVSHPWVLEKLFVVFPESSPFSQAESVTLEELDGQTFLIQNHIGDWFDVVHEFLPNSRLLLQEDRSTLLGVARKCEIPRFMSNMTMSFDYLVPGETAVPVEGPGSKLQIWCTYPRNWPPRYFNAISKIDIS